MQISMASIFFFQKGGNPTGSPDFSLPPLFLFFGKKCYFPMRVWLNGDFVIALGGVFQVFGSRSR